MLVSTVAVATDNIVGAKTYKPEVRYDNGKYFVKTSDPSAKGKLVGFLINQNNQEDPYFLYNAIPNYQNQEVELPKDTMESNVAEPVNENRLVSIKDSEDANLPDRELEDISDADFNKKKNEYYKEVASGAVSIKDALNGKQGSTAKVNVETSQPKLEPKEEPKASPDNPKTVSQQGLDAKNIKESKLDTDSTIGEKVKEKQENLSSIFGQNSELNKKDVKNKSNDRVDNKKSNEILANTGLRKNSYALLTSIVGLVGAIALRREKR